MIFLKSWRHDWKTLSSSLSYIWVIFQDGFLERLSLSEFDTVMRAIEEFVCNCQTLIGNEKKVSSPLRLCILQQGSSFIKKFHEDRKTKLGYVPFR